MIWILSVIVWFLVFGFLWRWAKRQEQERQEKQEKQEKAYRQGQAGRQGEIMGQGWQADESDKGQEGKAGSQRKMEEGYVDIAISPSLNKDYQAFLAIYQPLMTRWEEALDMAYQLELPAPTTAGPPPRPSSSDLQRILQKLLQQGKPLPPVPSSVPPFPASIGTVQEMEAVLPHLPADVQPYQNALDWMNDQFLRSQRKLQAALRGEAVEGFEEGFEDGQCAAFQSCYQQMMSAQQEEAAQRAQRIQQEFKSRLDAFQSPRLRQAFELNERLGREVKEIQRKSQSGDWIKDVSIPDKGPKPVYEMPMGADALEEMRLKDPARYAEYQKKYGSMFSLKQLMEQINRTLGR